MLTQLPDTLIIKELRHKFSTKQQPLFDYTTVLSNFNKNVSDEVKYINVLFPEYTPHDSEYHLSRLYGMADDIIGESLIKNLNVSELLIMSIALYGHDWGMAVSEAEKQLIIKGKIASDINPNNFALIEDEHKNFKRFKSVDYPNSPEETSLEIWQEYVRHTHALRSGARVRKYFNEIDKGIGEAAARVCEGHWLDFKNIEDNQQYPVNYSVAGDLVNIKALSIYVRLIDLLDISRDRTPYIIWKFVAPRNSRSKMEWQKHQAINSIKCDSFQSGRGIQIDGDTNDNEVYAALMDLKNYCSDQLKGCNEILNQLNDSQYDLNIFEINWRIVARGFKPVSIQFEFDRVRMFDVLSEEIYQGDKYVFLRELLQNSIDAIKLRREMLKKKGLSPSSEMGLIEVKSFKIDGVDVIEFTDDGSGMDEYIVRNYLSIAGKSYYSSDDFKKLGITLDPISKFGVGVLSCFMVADRVDIETFRDPYCNAYSEALSIRIPSVYQQFRITITNNESARIGTKFRIFLSPSKLSDDTRGPSVDSLSITEYLKAIAGFVDFPIKISENDTKTVIINPKIDAKKIAERFPDHEIHSINLNYPFEEAVMTNNVRTVKSFFTELSIDIQSDLRIPNASGKITFLVPKNQQMTITEKYTNWSFTEYIIDKTNTSSSFKRVQINDHWIFYRNIYDYQKERFGKSAASKQQFQVYLDGILVSGVSVPEEFDRSKFSSPSFGRFALPHIVINFNKKGIKGIDLSRTAIIDRHNTWAKTIWDNYLLYIKSLYEEKIKILPPKDRLLQIVQLLSFYRVPMDDLKFFIPYDEWPIPIIEKGGVFKVHNADELPETIYFQPLYFNHFSKFILVTYQGHKLKKNRLDNWKTEPMVLCEFEDSSDREFYSDQALSILRLSEIILNDKYELSQFRFMRPRKQNIPPLIQPIFVLRSLNEDKLDNREVDVIEKIVRTDEDLTFSELNLLFDLINEQSDTNYRISLPRIGNFDSPFKSKFAYSYKVLNWSHPTTKVLLKIISVGLMEDVQSAPVQVILDLLNELPFFNTNVALSGFKIADINRVIDELQSIILTHQFNVSFNQTTDLQENDFVDDSLYFDKQEDDKYFDFQSRINTDHFDDCRSFYNVMK
jgi:hypothetical protein